MVNYCGMRYCEYLSNPHPARPRLYCQIYPHAAASRSYTVLQSAVDPEFYNTCLRPRKVYPPPPPPVRVPPSHLQFRNAVKTNGVPPGD